MLDKTFSPQDVEKRISAQWEASGAFRAGNRPQAEAFSIVIPPPNVTGRLHIGHALNNTLQDILARFERMRGKDVLWQPGTDHAGIATQLIVERQLAERQMSRAGLGREKFLDEVWKWKAESGGAIVEQLHRLGASADWSRERFTMDEGLSRAVTKVFVELHKQGLIYKDKRLVNWDPRLQTAVSDLEVESIEVKGHLWHIKYPIEDTGEFITVATTRPETMLGDTAVAVHPEDARYTHLVGRMAVLPLTGRLIPIVADSYSDPEKGTGAVKITPGHDFNDFEVGKRHNLPLINLINRDGTLNDEVPAPYRGLSREAARRKIVADLEAMDLVEKIEPITHAVPHDEKTKTVVLEPFLTEQWYLNVQPLADKAIAAVEKGETKFVPENWANVYFGWLKNIRPWCISRQLWWGHQIPVWYDADGNIYCAETEDEAVKQAGGKPLTRDADVLDTWFSSALWPFSTMGWPDDTIELKRFYPTSVLVTGFDIIFFWVARMMMMGLHFMKDVPFPTVYIHALVRDEKGAKMSKSKGNVIDPLHLIDDYGADALRFTLAAMAAQGRDIKLSTQRVEGYRNFATKLWNASRFAEMNGCALVDGFDPSATKETLNRWIAHETARATREVTDAIQAYRFNDAAGAMYRFVWNVFCDWYLELAKPVLMGPDSPAKAETQASIAWARDEILKLLHPFMPFLTEELWGVTATRSGLLALAEWPLKPGPDMAAVMAVAAAGDPLAVSGMAALPREAEQFSDPAAESEIGWLIDLVSSIRSLRAEMNIPPATLFPLVLVGASDDIRARAERWSDVMKRLARLGEISFADRAPDGSVQLLVRGEVAAIPLKGVIDLGAEKARLDKELAKAQADIARVDAKLSNEKFVANAPEDVIDEQREKREEAETRKTKILEALERLKDVA